MLTPRYRDAIMVAIGVAVIILDQVTKSWVLNYFTINNIHPPVPVFGDYLTIDFTQNNGVAFSLFWGQNIKFVFIGLALCVIAYLFWRFRETGPLALKLGFGLVLGGAMGNLIDRFTHGFVVDFIHFQIPGRFDFAVFNVADSAICIGVVLVALLLYRVGQQESSDGHSADTAATQTLGDNGAAPRVRRKVSGVR
ncbi:MAG: signal peptidase II [Ktedonobacterales bacterium]